MQLNNKEWDLKILKLGFDGSLIDKVYKELLKFDEVPNLILMRKLEFSFLNETS